VKEYKNETEDYIEKNKQDLKKEEKEEARQELLGNLWNKELPEVIEEASEVVKVTKKEDIIEYLKKKAEKLNKNS
jgi:hemerythrin-like domain-containing protein